jgi:8-oxo-dGTP pyrophosphatase MutT (NUDIX family)
LTLHPSAPADAATSREGADGQPARQVAALVWRPAPDGLDVLLITSRNTRRWVVPKGWPIDGLSPEAAAAQEAFEEAGAIVGEGESLGSYRYDKIMKDGTLFACVVAVFALPVVRLLDEWPEKEQRTRRWYGARAAAVRVAESDLAQLMSDFGSRNTPAGR